MSTTPQDELKDMLDDGWEISGYTANMLAAGAMQYNILLRKGSDLTNYSILWNGASELARGKTILCPAPAPKKGFFG